MSEIWINIHIYLYAFNLFVTHFIYICTHASRQDKGILTVITMLSSSQPCTQSPHSRRNTIRSIIILPERAQAEGHIQVAWIDGKENLVDAFTKVTVCAGQLYLYSWILWWCSESRSMGMYLGLQGLPNTGWTELNLWRMYWQVITDCTALWMVLISTEGFLGTWAHNLLCVSCNVFY
jgi:hypothetical protein